MLDDRIDGDHHERNGAQRESANERPIASRRRDGVASGKDGDRSEKPAQFRQTEFPAPGQQRSCKRDFSRQRGADDEPGEDHNSLDEESPYYEGGEFPGRSRRTNAGVRNGGNDDGYQSEKAIQFDRPTRRSHQQERLQSQSEHHDDAQYGSKRYPTPLGDRREGYARGGYTALSWRVDKCFLLER